MKYIVIAPHGDDEVVGCFSKINSSEVVGVIYVTDNNDGRKEQSKIFCNDYNLDYYWLGYKDGSIIDLDENLRYGLLDKINSIIDKYGANISLLIPSCIDRNYDHTVIGGLISSDSKLDSIIYYSYTNTLPRKNLTIKEICNEKMSIMEKYYPNEYINLKSKGLLDNYCYFSKYK